MTKMAMSSLKAFPCFLLLLAIALCIDSTRACDNRKTQWIVVRAKTAKTSLQCHQIKTRRDCRLTDSLTGTRVRWICRDQCLSRCKKSSSPSSGSPTSTSRPSPVTVRAGACGNERTQPVVVRINSVETSLQCYQVKRRKTCRLIDSLSGERVKRICGDQCLRRCNVTSPTPSALPTSQPSPDAIKAGPCGNKKTQRIIVQVDSVKKSLRCRQIKKRETCRLTDSLTGKLVKKVCGDQCLRRCKVSLPPSPVAPTTLPSPVTSTTMAPTAPISNKLPTIAPSIMTNPTKMPSATRAPTVMPDLTSTNPPVTAPVAASPPTTLPTPLPVISPVLSPIILPSLIPASSPIAPQATPTSSPVMSAFPSSVTTPVTSPILLSTISPVMTPTAPTSLAPTTFPTDSPVLLRTTSPVSAPTAPTTPGPDSSPIVAPVTPSINTPTMAPFTVPTAPTSLMPTTSPVAPPIAPSVLPPVAPVATPNTSPVAAPVVSPVVTPVASPILAPVSSPVAAPVASPVVAPDVPPVAAPVPSPIVIPVASPVSAPVATPFEVPVASPVASPVMTPIASPIMVPVGFPSVTPVASPTVAPIAPQVSAPTALPVAAPVASPTVAPIAPPVSAPTALPVAAPVASPVMTPIASPIMAPVGFPSVTPVASPTVAPIAPPVSAPTASPVAAPVASPVMTPIASPIMAPVGFPSVTPVASPTEAPQVAAPVASPVTPSTAVPTIAPTTAVVVNSVPFGPYITAAGNSKVITLPSPPTPILKEAAARTECPHLQNGLRSWHDPDTWPSKAVPSAGSDVTLPANAKVIIQQSVIQKLGVVTVPASSELIFGEAMDGITMLVKGMDVQGKLVIGSESCRIERPVTITLWGTRPSNAVQNSLPSPSTKGIYVTGTLSLHGKRFFATWSRLAQTIQAGDTVLLLQLPVNWERGQEVVLTSSIIYDSRAYHQNEIVTVYQVEAAANTPAGVGAVIHLSQPVQHKHVANEFYQVEAGLLSRTIVVQGSEEDSEPTDMDPRTCNSQDQYPYASWHFLHNLPMPCTNTEKTGYGGHVMIAGNGTAQVEGIKLFRMGQTNLLGRYPVHFHLLKDCPTCYFKDSSVHRSYYRCVSIHGTNQATVSENVAYDIIGYCYYLEDGIEQDNTISFNLAAHIHTIGPDIPSGGSQRFNDYDQSAVAGDELTLPADVTASGFYITNVHNNLVGNAASGGWAGFAFPVLPKPIGLHTQVMLRPGSANGLTIDGNTAHSTGFWWEHAGAFYLGGSLYNTADGLLRYNPGRANTAQDARRPCAVYTGCVGDCRCSEPDTLPLSFTNSKTFLTAGVGLNSWTGRMNVEGFEAYDSRLSIEALSDGFWVDNLYVACRTGEDLGFPAPGSAHKMEGSGFYWYDTGQSHIITNAVFQNCGYRSDEFNQYENSPTRGCGDELSTSDGCKSTSTTFGFLTHSDEHVPELMQATKALTFIDGGRKFRFGQGLGDSVSGRIQNWLDIDGTASGLDEPVLIGSGLPNATGWWGVDDDVMFDTQGPVSFIKKNNGPSRGLAHVRFSWDAALHAKVGNDFCFNNAQGTCPLQGYVRHVGRKFSPGTSFASKGLPITINPDAVGPVGGFGWVLKLDAGAPRDLNITQIEVDPDNVLLLSIAYPVGTVFTITANAESCWVNAGGTCQEFMTAVPSVEEVRNGAGNTYYVDASGVLTMRVFQLAKGWTGNPSWLGIPSWDMIARNGVEFAVPRFERNGIKLLNFGQSYFRVQADCGGTGVYCSETVVDYDPDVCQAGYEQVAYDKCCSKSSPSQCTFADGTTTSR